MRKRPSPDLIVLFPKDLFHPCILWRLPDCLLRTDRPEIINTPVACWVGHAVGPLWYLNEGYSISGDGMNHQLLITVRHNAQSGVRRM